MAGDFDIYSRLSFAVAASLAIGATSTGCSDPVVGDDQEQPPGPVSTRTSRSSTIALSDDGALVAMVNPEDGTLSVFSTTDNSRIAKVATGGAPSSVVIAADNKTAYVSNRTDGTVVRIANIDGGTPAIDATIEVGAEPMGLALSPTGKKLFVAEYAESRVSIIDTGTKAVVNSFAFDRPRALLVTNNLDTSDDDETLVVAEFFGRPVAEAKDDGRTGYVRLLSLANLDDTRPLTLSPIDSGFTKGGVTTNPTVKTAPNQLGAINIANDRLYITSVSASPEAPARFDNNVFPVVYVADMASSTEVSDASGTVNLARKIYDAIPSPSPTNPRFIPGELSDIDFVPDTNVAYAIGRAGDVMVRVTFGDASGDMRPTQNKRFDLAGNETLGKCQGPTGVVIDKAHTRAYVNCWLTRKLGVVDLATQSMTNALESAPLPTAAAEASVVRGRRFYSTGRGRWSANIANGAKGGEGWSSCASCHPDGLTDNMTWVFGSGPRQTTSQDGSFSHGPGVQKQRIFNWTGLFDEQHDFERNTRDTSGGLGAITTAPTLAECGQLDKETRVDISTINGLQKPLKEVQDDAAVATCGHKDWDDIDNFVKTIAPVQARKTIAADAVERGRALFAEGGCAKCHGGQGWTVSRRFFTPGATTNSNLAATQFGIPTFFPATWQYNVDQNSTPTQRMHASGQPAIPMDLSGPAEAAPVAVGQVACSLRNVGTFGIPNNPTGTDALELRPKDGNLIRSQGRAGYNVPSLYGLSLGAPYLHHGQSPSLKDLLTNTAWQFHTNAGNANFSLTLADASKLGDLTAFLYSIDAKATEVSVPTDTGTGASFDACPQTF